MTDHSRRTRILPYIVGAGFVIAGLIRTARNERTPEEQERLAKLRARDDEREEQRRREYSQRELARQSAVAYFGEGGEGRRLLDAATLTTIPVGEPFPDAPPKDPRVYVERSSSVSSASANGGLTLSLDPRDGMGHISFQQGISVRFAQTFEHHPYRDAKYLHLEGDDLEMFKVIARLLASLGRGFDGIRVRRSDWQDVREKLWEKHLASNSALADEIGWTGSGPYTYL
jgi:hypothetical protein